MKRFFETWRSIFLGLTIALCAASMCAGFPALGKLANQLLEKIVGAYCHKCDPRDCDCGGKTECETPCADPIYLGDLDNVTNQHPRIRLRTTDLVRNCAGKDGGGLNVPACIQCAANRQGIASLRNLMATAKEHPGGYYETKVDTLLQVWHPSNAKYDQLHAGEHVLDLLESALGMGRIPCVAFDGSKKRYSFDGPKTCVCLLHLDADETDRPRACVWDPNFPIVVDWMPKEEFVKRSHATDGEFWAIILRP